MAFEGAPSRSLSARNRRRERTRQELAIAAIRLIEENGFNATTAEDMALAADYSVATFFRMFPRKEDVVFFDLPSRLDALKEAFAESTHGPAWSTIRELFIADATEWERNDSALPISRIELIHREPAVFSRFLEYCQEWEDVVAELLAAETGRDRQADIPTRVIAGATLAATRAAMRTQRLTGGSFAQHLTTALDVLESGPLSAAHLT